MIDFKDRISEIPKTKLAKYIRRFPQVTDLAIGPSDNQNKRFCAYYTMNGIHYKTTFGSKYGFTYLDGASKETRNNYRKRASRIKNKAGEYTYKLPGSANSFSYWLLW